MYRKSLTLGLTVLTALGASSCSKKRNHPPALQILQTVSFETRTEIDSGLDTSVDFAVGDLNNDVQPDLAIVSFNGRVSIQLGQNNGTFAPGQTIDLGGRVTQIAEFDMDVDGDLDLAVLRRDVGRVTLLRNQGNATFDIVAAELTGMTDPAVMAVGDVNADGLPDIVCSEWNRPEVVVFLGQPGGTFAPASVVALPAGTACAGVVVAEVTGDGRGDIAVADRDGNQILVLPSLTAGGFGAPTGYPTGAYPVELTALDVDQDGAPELISSNFLGRSLTVLRLVNGFSSQSILLAGSPARVAMADVDGDFVPELLTSFYEQSTVVILPGLGGGAFGDVAELTAGGQPSRIAAADVNGDGNTDLLTSGGLSPMLSLFVNQGGRLTGAYTYRTGIDAPEFVVAADFDNDGKGELVVAGRSTTQLTFLRADGPSNAFGDGVEVVLTIDVGLPVFNLTKGDFDQDGKLDIAIACQGGVKLLANNSTPGTLRFDLLPGSGGQILIPADGPFEIQAADLDGDGLAELVLTDALREVVEVHSRIGRFGYAVTRRSLPVLGLPGGLAIADFDRDGVLDLAVSRADRNIVTLLKNLGGLTFVPMLDIAVGAGPNYLRTADFNRDLVGDLVVSNGAGDTLTVILSTGSSAFRTIDFPVGKRPTALLTQDLNRDGFADILTASLTGADFHVLLGDGRGGFQQLVAFPGTNIAVSADLTDMNGDGLPDLAIASVATQRISLYRNISR